jgi:hypothetical protein
VLTKVLWHQLLGLGNEAEHIQKGNPMPTQYICQPTWIRPPVLTDANGDAADALFDLLQKSATGDRLERLIHVAASHAAPCRSEAEFGRVAAELGDTMLSRVEAAALCDGVPLAADISVEWIDDNAAMALLSGIIDLGPREGRLNRAYRLAWSLNERWPEEQELTLRAFECEAELLECAKTILHSQEAVVCGPIWRSDAYRGELGIGAVTALPLAA